VLTDIKIKSLKPRAKLYRVATQMVSCSASFARASRKVATFPGMVSGRFNKLSHPPPWGPDTAVQGFTSRLHSGQLRWAPEATGLVRLTNCLPRGLDELTPGPARSATVRKAIAATGSAPSGSLKLSNGLYPAQTIRR